MLPAYAGLLSSMGLAFVLETGFLLPITIVTLLLALGALAFRATRRRGYAPFYAGIPAAGLIVAGKFAFDSALMMYGGTALLVAVSIWNAWPRKRRSLSQCPPSEV